MSGIDVSKDHAQRLLTQMLLVRRFEEAAAEQYAAGNIRGFLHLYIGEEAVAAGAISALREEDNIVATYREHGHALCRGVSANEVMAEMFGRASGCARGRGGSMHLYCARKNFYGGHAIVGGGLPVAVGLALADQMQQRSRVSACFFGDGATEEGEFHESLNLAALWQLPVLFLCENNLYAMGTAIERHASDVEIVHKPAVYGICAETVDGMDVLAVERAVRYAADTVRETGKPRFLEFKTYRFRAHSMYDPDRYRDKAEVAHFRERDPIACFKVRLTTAGLLDEGEFAAMEEAVAAEVQGAVEFAERAPLEPVEDLLRDVVVREVP